MNKEQLYQPSVPKYKEGLLTLQNLMISEVTNSYFKNNNLWLKLFSKNKMLYKCGLKTTT